MQNISASEDGSAQMRAVFERMKSKLEEDQAVAVKEKMDGFLGGKGKMAPGSKLKDGSFVIR